MALDEPLLATPAPATQAAQTVAVEAPADLEAGYTFEASYSGTRFNVLVPEGGVKKGQRIMLDVPLVAVAQTVSVTQPFSSGSIVQDPLALSIIPTGRWREGFCDCFEHGCCEPSCCLAYWCNGIALGQVMTRMKLTAAGEEASTPSKVANTFAIVTSVWLIYSILVCVKSVLTRSEILFYYYDPSYLWNAKRVALTVISLISFLIGIYFLYIGTVTRMRMRKAFGIPGNCLGDCCAFFWCRCCTVVQMARHTHDYDVHESSCCSKTGLRDDAPEVV
jgi:Cys-rich protein (TIGR01571 family)